MNEDKKHLKKDWSHIVELYRSGATFEQIGFMFGIKKQSVHEGVTRQFTEIEYDKLVAEHKKNYPAFKESLIANLMKTAKVESVL